MSKDEFIEMLGTLVAKIAPSFGVVCNSAVIAQACLESAFGTSYKALFHNYFGLKYRVNRLTCHNGFFNDSSLEQLDDGSYIPTVDDWYSFDSMESGVRGYFEFISISNYSNLKGVTDPYEYLCLIKKYNYATDKDYVSKVYKIVVDYNLSRFDNLVSLGGRNMKYTVNNPPIVCMQTTSSCYKSTKEMTIRGILFHSTGANNPSIKRYVQPADTAKDKDELLKIIGVNKNRNDYNHIKLSSGLNAFIGKLEDGTVAVVQTMPWNYRPWGCGSGRYGSCNDGWIQFEICEGDLNDADYFNKVYNEAVELTAYLCKLYNLNPKGIVNVKGVEIPVITCHADSYKLGFGSNHGDINHWFPKYGKSMETVRADVANLLSKGVDTQSKPETSTTSKTIYYVQAGAFSIKSNADNRVKTLKSKGFDAIIKKVGNLYVVQAGAFSVKSNAMDLVNKLNKSCIEACITTN